MKKFRMAHFCNLLKEKEGASQEEASRHFRLLTLFDHLVELDSLDEDTLELFTHEDIEWLEDLIQYWPTYDMEEEDISLSHIGIEESLKINWFFQQMNHLRSVRKERFL